MPTLHLKSGAGWDLEAKYSDGMVRFHLVSQADKRRFGDFSSLGLTEAEWKRLVAWVNYQRAEEAARVESRGVNA